MLPVYKPWLTELEKRYVDDALDSTWISSKGPYIERFEREFASYCGVAHGVSTCNGTVSLHVILEALGIGPGDEVIVPAFTYVASVNAITYAGATPVFVDSDPRFYTIDPALVEAAITPRTRAIEVVHLYGHPCDMDPIAAIADARGIPVIEDAAEAHGATYRGRMVGSLGRAASFSFFGNKIVTTGEGGMVVTDDEDLAEKCRHLKGQGVSPTQTYWHDVVGYNYRMTNIQAALGCAQLERVAEVLSRKRAIDGWYRERLASVSGVEMHAQAQWAEPVAWMVSIRVDPSLRDSLMAHLAECGIETRPFFHAAHTLPMYPRDEAFPVAEALSASGMNMPSFPELTVIQVDEVCARIAEFMGRHG